jgi:hypothetical protein
VRRLKRHLSVANVLSCTALFVALSGAAYAVSPLGNKSVKTRNLANGAVTTLKLRGGAVTPLKLRNGAVTSAKIAPGAVGSTQLADGGVRSADLGGGVVTTNKLKDGAVTEAKLATSVSTQLIKNASYAVKTSVSNSEAKSETAECQPGKEAIGGGARLLGANTQLALIESAPVINGGGKWTAAAVEFAPEAGDWSIQVIAVCAEL